MDAAEEAGRGRQPPDARGLRGQPSIGDPTLRDRLRQVALPILVLWGDSDQIVDLDYGRGYAAAIPGARSQLLLSSGQVPKIETLDQLLEAIRAFVDRSAAPRHE